MQNNHQSPQKKKSIPKIKMPSYVLFHIVNTNNKNFYYCVGNNNKNKRNINLPGQYQHLTV